MGLFTEFWCFTRDDKLWWITPIVVVPPPFGLLVLVTNPAAAPFLYPLFQEIEQ